jgi:murein DD-endopeptidase MepM/ murein hydrolase activator NlpD
MHPVRTLISLGAAVGIVAAGLVLPAQASPEFDPANATVEPKVIVLEGRSYKAPKRHKRKVCPTTEFWVGAGWGAPRGNRLHRGIDLGGKRGTPIFAVERGYINRTKKQSNGSLQIVLQGRSGSKYYYGHMDEVLVRSGQKVKRGQVIGLMGDTGSPGAVHLHFEYWRSGRESAAIDPERLMKRICKI